MDRTDQGAPARGALQGIRVVDLSRVLGGPLAGQILADHGADVVKVEPPQGDETRDWGPPFQGDASSYFLNVNRNKRALALDLRTEGGRGVLLRLLEHADVLIENFKPGTMEGWGLGFDVLSQRFPRLVHASVTGFGPDGPLGGYPGYDLLAQAWTGMVSVNGSAESGPLRLGMPVVDMATGQNAVIGILLALLERQRSGRGQHVDLTLYDTGISLLHPQAPNWFMSGVRPGLTGNEHPNIAPYSLHRTKGAPVFITVGNNGQFRRLCEVIGRPDLAADERFRTNADRVRNRRVLTEAIEAAICERDGEELAIAMLEAGVPGGAVLPVDKALQHPHTLHRQMVVSAGDYRGVGIPVKLSRTPGSVRTPPPDFNADGAGILAEAGYSGEEIDTLLAEGAVRTERQRHG